MSPAELLRTESPEEAVPFSVRLAARRAIRTVAPGRPSDRRAHSRRRAEDLDWLRSVRVTGGTGFGVTLIDLSEGGALIEVDGPLRPGVKLTLELIGDRIQAAVRFEVLRSYIASLRGGSTFYRGACAFAYLIDLPTNEPAAPQPSSAFVGTDAALSYLLDRASMPGVTPAGTEGVSLEPEQVVKVLECLHARRSSSHFDPAGQNALELLGAILPALQRGASRRDAAAALECRLKTLPRNTQQELQSTSTRLAALIDRCLPEEIEVRPAQETAIANGEAVQAGSAFQKIVVRFADGSLAKGYTQDFHPSRPHFSLWPAINAKPSERVAVAIVQLKAIFFVRDFGGNPGHRERKSFTARSHGRRVEVTFADTEVVLGTTLNYRPDAQGFFLNPADTEANNTRIFVVASAVRGVRFL